MRSSLPATMRLPRRRLRNCSTSSATTRWMQARWLRAGASSVTLPATARDGLPMRKIWRQPAARDSSGAPASDPRLPLSRSTTASRIPLRSRSAGGSKGGGSCAAGGCGYFRYSSSRSSHSRQRRSRRRPRQRLLRPRKKPASTRRATSRGSTPIVAASAARPSATGSPLLDSASGSATTGPSI